MKFSYQWISELAGKPSLDAKELSRLITMKTAECEGIHSIGEHFTNVRAARVISVEPIAGGKNVKCVIDLGHSDHRTVVCGAPNCRTGIVAAYVPSGTKLGDREIGRVVIGGVESDGMLASAAELGIGRDAGGILELDLKPGEALPLGPDQIIEIDNKSLTHRPDLWGHFGMAREIAAILKHRLQDPVKLTHLPEPGSPIGVTIENYQLCPRYSALVFENVTVLPSPLWLQYRLESIGLNPINNIVDVTNFVMAELSQPMHAFDADKLKGGILVRSAKGEETIAALNGESYVLNPTNLVIADESGPIAIAGVIGGNDSAIGPGTKRIVLESACFEASSVRKTSASLKLRTDASMRFEKSQDPHTTVRGLARALDLLREVSPGIRLAGGLVDHHKELPQRAEIELPLDWLDRKLGRSVDAREVRGILEALEFGVREARPRVLSVTVPSWRATKDVSIKEDLVEEIGRMTGYDAITPVAPLVPAKVPPRNPERDYERVIRQITAAQGFHEVYNYSFLSEEDAQRFSIPNHSHVHVTNPIAAGQNLLRDSLVPGIWHNLIENSKYSDSFRLFEIGSEIHPRPGEAPEEVTRLAAAIYIKRSASEDSAAGLFELKRLAECLAPEIVVEPATARPYEHPARAVALFLQGQPAGRLFEFHPAFIEHGRGSVLDLDLDVLRKGTGRGGRYQAIQRFPSSAFDLSIIADLRDFAGNIERKLHSFAGPELERIEFVRQYEGPPLPEGKKSISFRVTLAAPDRTLSAEEAGVFRSNLIQGMRASGYDLRA